MLAYIKDNIAFFTNSFFTTDDTTYISLSNSNSVRRLFFNVVISSFSKASFNVTLISSWLVFILLIVYLLSII